MEKLLSKLRHLETSSPSPQAHNHVIVYILPGSFSFHMSTNPNPEIIKTSTDELHMCTVGSGWITFEKHDYERFFGLVGKSTYSNEDATTLPYAPRALADVGPPRGEHSYEHYF